MARARLSLTKVISNLYIRFATNSAISPQQPNGLFDWNGHGYFIAEQREPAQSVDELTNRRQHTSTSGAVGYTNSTNNVLTFPTTAGTTNLISTAAPAHIK